MEAAIFASHHRNYIGAEDREREQKDCLSVDHKDSLQVPRDTPLVQTDIHRSWETPAVCCDAKHAENRQETTMNSLPLEVCLRRCELRRKIICNIYNPISASSMHVQQAFLEYQAFEKVEEIF